MIEYYATTTEHVCVAYPIDHRGGSERAKDVLMAMELAEMVPAKMPRLAAVAGNACALSLAKIWAECPSDREGRRRHDRRWAAIFRRDPS